MKIEFKKLQYQLDAVRAVADCFKGQPKEVAQRYTIDQGTKRDKVKNNLFKHHFSLMKTYHLYKAT